MPVRKLAVLIRSYDVALMRTVAPMGPSESIIPICLPNQNTPEMFETVYAAGSVLITKK